MLIIVDGSSLLYRYAVMGAVMGAINKVIQVAEKWGQPILCLFSIQTGSLFDIRYTPNIRQPGMGTMK